MESDVLFGNTMSGDLLRDPPGSETMVSPETVWRNKYNEEMCSGLRSLLDHKSYSDITIKVQDKEYKCHRVILSLMSPYFDAMFSSGMRESHDSTIVLKDIESQMFEYILDFIYGGRDVVATDDIADLLEAASMLQIKVLQERCEEFMIEKVDTENCIASWKLASAHGCSHLIRKSFQCVLQGFDELSATDAFLTLDKEEVMDLIRDNDLNSPSEENVCNAVLNWVNHDIEERGQFIGELMEFLRLPLVQPEYLLEVLERSEVVQQDEKCKTVIEEAKRYHLLPARRQEFVSPRLVYRNAGEFEEVIVCLGGSTEEQTTGNHVACYSFNTKAWYNLAPLPYNPGVEFSTCGYGNAIFVSGGSIRLKEMVYYNSMQNKWKICQSMLLGRRRHGMIAVGGSIYAIGGYDDSAEEDYRTLLSIEEYKISTDKWDDAGFLVIAVRSAAIAVDKERIYIFGGVTNGNVDTKSIQSYDTRLRTCTMITDLPVYCRLASGISYLHKMFLVIPSGNVIEFDEETKQVQNRGKILEIGRYHIGIVLRNGSIVMLGGTDGTKNYDELVSFDLANFKTTTLPDKLPKPMFGFGCIKTVINKKHLNSVFRVQ